MLAHLLVDRAFEVAARRFHLEEALVCFGEVIRTGGLRVHPVPKMDVAESLKCLLYFVATLLPPVKTMVEHFSLRLGGRRLIGGGDFWLWFALQHVRVQDAVVGRGGRR